ncbi:MAG TPA: hypothetical protein HPP76_08990 [Desulfuromonadales bacterium]|nr:hypothetical protein [Desulfuromonadales bacterium]
MNLNNGEALRRCVALLIAAIVVIGCREAVAKPVTVTREYTYRASEADSKLTSRTMALEQIKRLLVEELGTYLISNTEVKDSALTRDEIVTYTAGWVTTVVIKESWNGEDYYLKAQISADAGEVARAVAALHEDRDKATELKQFRAQSNELLGEIKLMRQELAQLKSSANPGSSARAAEIQKNYEVKVSKLAGEEVETSFDGRWAVSLICDDVKSTGGLVKGYTLHFYANVKEGRLLGQHGVPGQPSSLTMIGFIRQGGGAEIHARGLTGNQEYNVGRVLPNRPYSYRMRGTFSPTSGKATRVELRPCEAAFFKQ